MRIDVYEILGTNSLSGSRIIINDNFKMLEDGINEILQYVDIEGEDSEKTVNIKNIDSIDTKKITIDGKDFIRTKNGVISIIDETNGEWITLNDILKQIKEQDEKLNDILKQLEANDKD